MSTLLKVYLNEDHVGNLWLDNKNFCFRYVNLDTQPISLSLPVREEPYLADEARPYFANLLPEGDTRTLVEARLGTPRGDDFALLRVIGGDCAGAITLFPEEQIPFVDADYKELSNDELITLIKELPRNPLGAGRSEKVRLSLPGAQNKTTLYRKDGVYYEPENGAPSSHILKIPITQHDGIVDTVHNETFVMMLAKAVGLNVPDVEMVIIGEIPVFIIERYDRFIDNDMSLKRILQEDFCQLLGFDPCVKYQRQGGPSLEHCVEKVREHSSNITEDLDQLLKWVAFNVLIGNADAHAKNLSMIWGKTGIRLAPFYDLLSTSVYGDSHDKDFAMAIGRQYHTEQLTRDDWKTMAEYLDISPKLVAKSNAILLRDIELAIKMTLQEFNSRYGSNLTIDKIIEGVIDRKKLLMA
ncbi:MAG: type II toxin-antitoxin system HipA family toxin [Deltaproteobacteria bacterium]|nr:type II toxin-antitoxin system HipA family toxin [Deltaproteobacteria bacterium]